MRRLPSARFPRPLQSAPLVGREDGIDGAILIVCRHDLKCVFYRSCTCSLMGARSALSRMTTCGCANLVRTDLLQRSGSGKLLRARQGQGPIAWSLQKMSYGAHEFAIKDRNGYVIAFQQASYRRHKTNDVAIDRLRTAVPVHTQT